MQWMEEKSFRFWVVAVIFILTAVSIEFHDFQVCKKLGYSIFYCLKN